MGCRGRSSALPDLACDFGYLKALIVQAGNVHCCACDDGDILLHHPELSNVGLALCNPHPLVCDVLSGPTLQHAEEEVGMVRVDVLTQGCMDGLPLAGVTEDINVWQLRIHVCLGPEGN